MSSHRCFPRPLVLSIFGLLVGLDGRAPSRLAASEFADQAAAPKPDPHPCQNDPQRRRFDFWIGEWDVRGAKAPANAPPASSSIQSVVEGCAILENYRHGPYSGTSHTSWDATIGKWVQNYVDSTGLLSRLVGDFDAKGSLVLESDVPARNGQPAARTRLSFTPLGPNRVRQLWEQTTDQGKTWTVMFDGDYRRKGVAE
jgi:hypothetical protein